MPPIEVRPMLNEAVIGARRVRLSVMLSELLAELAKGGGKTVRTPRLLCVAENVRNAYRWEPAADERRALHAQIHELRARLRGTGLTVSGERGRAAEGYALAEEAA